MPYVPHKAFHEPEGAQCLMRFVSLGKLLSLIQRRALFFASPKLLEDPFEGTMTHPTAMTLQGDEYSLRPFGVQALLDEYRDHHFVNCWHMSERESVAMWAQYGQQEEAVAIVTTHERLKQSLAPSPDEVFIGAVQYIDYESDVIIGDNLLAYYLHKRKGFEHEREVRALVADLKKKYVNQGGIFVPIDTDQLLVEVRVSPIAGSWLKATIQDLLQRYGIDIPVQQSALAARPYRVSNG